VSITEDYLHFDGSATIAKVLQAYLDREAHWWWLLTTEREGQYYVCSFGSLLPYLTGRTLHIVHNVGHCLVCSAMDPLLWQDTARLVEEALADAAVCARRVADLPMAELPTVDAQDAEELAMMWGPARGVIEDDVISGVYIVQMKGELGGMPRF
jgi:hypothetical protein